ncbi:flavodoxin FldA [Escherichia coli]|nr:flavodoxin FldA [Escherichia coli]
MAKSSKEDLEAYDILLLGIPTLVLRQKRSVTGMTSSRLSKRLISTANWLRCLVVVTREDYAEYFCDALGTIRDIIEPRGATIVGHWPTAGYHFEASKGLADDDHFVGLAIDEDRQPELTAERVEKMG